MFLFSRWFNRQARSKSPASANCHGRRDEMHSAFRTKPGRGPFLLSPDGRVIPLRKARFLQDK